MPSMVAENGVRGILAVNVILQTSAKKTKESCIYSENNFRPVQCINTVSSTSFLIGVASEKSPHTFTKAYEFVKTIAYFFNHRGRRHRGY